MSDSFGCDGPRPCVAGSVPGREVSFDRVNVPAPARTAVRAALSGKSNHRAVCWSRNVVARFASPQRAGVGGGHG